MSLAIETQGTTVTWNEIAVGEVVSFSGPGGVAGTYDVTHLLSTKREKRPSLPDEGDYTMECNFLPDDPGQQALMADRATRTVREVIVTYSDGSTDTFQAYCTGAVKSGGVDNKVGISFTLAITGDVVESYVES
jgi:hypothetical protein